MALCLGIEEDGMYGTTYQNGAEINIENGMLIPGFRWRRPIWDEDIMTREQAIIVSRVAFENGIRLTGSIPKAFEIENAYAEEEKWLKEGMAFIRAGRVPIVRQA